MVGEREQEIRERAKHVGRRTITSDPGIAMQLGQTDVPKLLDRVEQLEGALEDAAGEIERLDDVTGGMARMDIADAAREALEGEGA
jgi:hypothetical protein